MNACTILPCCKLVRCSILIWVACSTTKSFRAMLSDNSEDAASSVTSFPCLPAPAASLPAAANIPATQNSPLHKPAPPQIQSAQILPARKPPADICQTPELWQSLLKCPRAFVEKRCRGETSADFRAFRQNDVACRPAYGKAAPWSRNLPVFREGASPEGRNALENFIFGD